ncbi:MAG: site-2 protease family protein [Armatimonadetes bacterium]|nr:site-2 protease family protein [Armatimonadota bacterium]
MSSFDFALETLVRAPNAILAIAVVLGLAILFHEAGHFFAARLCGVGVEEFAVGLGPVLWRRRRGDTVFSLRLLPFGGFARIAGMEPGQADMPGGLYTRPRYVQALIFASGVVMNVVLALLLFTVVVFWQGLPDEKRQGVMVTRPIRGTPAAQAGFRKGDQVLAIDGHRDNLWIGQVQPGGVAARAGLREEMYISFVNERIAAVPSDLLAAMATAGPRGIVLTVMNPEADRLRDAYTRVRILVPPGLRLQAAETLKKPAVAADQAVGRLLGITWRGLTPSGIADYIALRPGKPIIFTVLRAGQVVELTVTPAPTWERVLEVGPDGMLRTPHRQVGRIGIVLGTPRRRPGVAEGLKSAGFATVSSVATLVTAIRAMVSREIEAELGGPIAIMAMTAEQARIGWDAVLNWGGLISANLAVLNLIPFPPFDGSYLLMVLLEAIARRRISERVRLAVTAAGFVLILIVFAVFTFSDIVNLVRYRTP